jgi:PAS domain-containing protein
MLRHKRVLVLVRLAFFILIAAMAIQPFAQGTLSPVLPIILIAYLITNLAMLFEKSSSFFTQRVQAALLVFDIFVLGLSLYYLEHTSRQGLFLAMFLVVLLSSAGQRLLVSIGGFVAIASFYIWLSSQLPGIKDQMATILTGVPVLLVVAIYVGYVSEAVSRERRQRLEAEDRLQKELHGMSRVQALTSTFLQEQDPARAQVSIAETARTMLGAPYAALFSLGKGDKAFQVAVAPGFPEPLSRTFAQATPDRSLLHRALQRGEILRVTSSTADPAVASWFDDGQGNPLEEILLSPFSDRVSGSQSCLLVAFPKPHLHLRVEEEAAQVLSQHAGLCIENSALYGFLTQARDVWQSAFQSIPTPVVIVDGRGKIIQINPAFLSLGEFDLSTIVGSSFDDVIAGATAHDGKPLPEGALQGWSGGPSRMLFPKLGGEFDVMRGPYMGAGSEDPGIVWVLRKLSAEVVG